MSKSINTKHKVRLLNQFFLKEGRLPGYNEMLELFGYRSKNAVYELLKKLEQLGYIKKTSKGKISLIRHPSGNIKLLGAVQAGFPSPAEEELVDTVNLEEFLIQRPDATYMLTVSGDSMIEAGIHPGDIVLVEKGIAPKTSDIVVAQIDDEWTIKYFINDSKGVRLVPANKKYTSITPKRSLVIGGIVRAVIRKYS